jgi:hypothetical protein
VFKIHSRFEVFTVVLKKIKVFLDVTPYQLLNSYRHLKEHGAFIFRVRQLKKTA